MTNLMKYQSNSSLKCLSYNIYQWFLYIKNRLFMMSIFILKKFLIFFKKCLTFYSWSFYFITSLFYCQSLFWSKYLFYFIPICNFLWLLHFFFCFWTFWKLDFKIRFNLFIWNNTYILHCFPIFVNNFVKITSIFADLRILFKLDKK